MSDLLDLAIDVAAIGVGLLTIGYTLWRASVERQRAGTRPLPPRAASVWKWRTVRGLCAGSGLICLGGFYLLRHIGVGELQWLFILGFLGVAGWLVALVMIAELGDTRYAQRRTPEDDTR